MKIIIKRNFELVKELNLQEESILPTLIDFVKEDETMRRYLTNDDLSQVIEIEDIIPFFEDFGFQIDFRVLDEQMLVDMVQGLTNRDVAFIQSSINSGRVDIIESYVQGDRGFQAYNHMTEDEIINEFNESFDDMEDIILEQFIDLDTYNEIKMILDEIEGE